MHNLKEIRKDFSKFEKDLERRSVKIDFNNLNIISNGKLNLLPKIKKSLSRSTITLSTKLKELEFIAKKIVKLKNIQDVHLDLCNLNTLNYQTDIIYTAYIPNMRKEIATGGRYTVNCNKDIRRASGFSLDLKDIYYISTRGKNV